MLSDLGALFINGSGSSVDGNHCGQGFEKRDTLQQEEWQLAQRLLVLVALQRLHDG